MQLIYTCVTASLLSLILVYSDNCSSFIGCLFLLSPLSPWDFNSTLYLVLLPFILFHYPLFSSFFIFYH